MTCRCLLPSDAPYPKLPRSLATRGIRQTATRNSKKESSREIGPRRPYLLKMDQVPDQFGEDGPEDYDRDVPARLRREGARGITVDDKAECRIAKGGGVQRGETGTVGRHAMTTQIQKDSARDENAEAERENREALPFAGACEM